jgi:hypothetical protein
MMDFSVSSVISRGVLWIFNGSKGCYEGAKAGAGFNAFFPWSMVENFYFTSPEEKE